MKNETLSQPKQPDESFLKNQFCKTPHNEIMSGNEMRLPRILFITSYPPRECGIATYSQDLVRSLKNKFNNSFELSICALECEGEHHQYKEKIEYTLDTDDALSFASLSEKINTDPLISIVFIQHEFGFFHKNEHAFTTFLKQVTKPKIVVFHTVLPSPDLQLKTKVTDIANAAQGIIVMTQSSLTILNSEYGIQADKITVIPHGTHLVKHEDKETLKLKYGFGGKKIIATFGLLSSGKNIETTLDALPEIVAHNPDILFLIIGKTHPSIVKNEQEQYRNMLEEKVKALQLQDNVQFINRFLALPDLLEYLQLTDIYLFTSKDPNQAVSGTFSYAMSCGCPIVSTPIPHAKELVQNGAGILIDFGNSKQLAAAVNRLFLDDALRNNISSNGLHNMAATAWENAAIAHARLFTGISRQPIRLQYRIPDLNLNHIRYMTTESGMIQFSKINQPDIHSGYTLDDNARALIVLCQHYDITGDETDLELIRIYLQFINHCQQADGSFLNYVDAAQQFTAQNEEVNLEDANGRAIWALGYLISLSDGLPVTISNEAVLIFEQALKKVNRMHSTRAMAFVIKGLYYRHTKDNVLAHHFIILELANRLVQMYRHENDQEWHWFENYLTYANSILPEALLCAWLATGKPVYKEIAFHSFNFLLSRIFSETGIHVISNKGWMHKGTVAVNQVAGGEQPIDVAYTIMALSKFYTVFKKESYLQKIMRSFNWFLGNNHLHQIIYNPCTGGCYDGLEEHYVNLNQGAESTLSYLMARLTVEEILLKERSKEQMHSYVS